MKRESRLSPAPFLTPTNILPQRPIDVRLEPPAAGRLSLEPRQDLRVEPQRELLLHRTGRLGRGGFAAAPEPVAVRVRRRNDSETRQLSVAERNVAAGPGHAGPGPTIGADLHQAELARLPADRSGGQLADTLRVPLDSSYLFERDSIGPYDGAAGVTFPAAGSAPDVRLEPFDQVMILKQPEFELQRTVDIIGEVVYPGPYALTSKEDRLSDLVQRAGGLLPTAYADGARFIRVLDRAGRVDLNLPAALAEPGSATDIVLQPGDSLFVPVQSHGAGGGGGQRQCGGVRAECRQG